MPHERIAAGFFLIDAYCLGVKKDMIRRVLAHLRSRRGPDVAHFFEAAGQPGAARPIVSGARIVEVDGDEG